MLQNFISNIINRELLFKFLVMNINYSAVKQLFSTLVERFLIDGSKGGVSYRVYSEALPNFLKCSMKTGIKISAFFLRISTLVEFIKS